MCRFWVLIGSLLFIACNGEFKAARHDSLPQASKSGKDSISKTAVLANTSDVKKQVFKPYKLFDDWMVLDSGEYDAGSMAGSYLIVQKNKQFVDTIEKGYGVIKVNSNSFLYQKLTLSKDENLTEDSVNEHFLSLSYADYILIQGHKNMSLKNTIKDFNFYFSSPYPINGKIYFWQIKDMGKKENYKFYAAEYNPTQNTTKATYLTSDSMGTDDAGYFLNPYAIKDTIYFALNDSLVWKFSPSFKPYK